MRGSNESRPRTARQLHLWVKHSLLPSGSKAFETATGNAPKSNLPLHSLRVAGQIDTVDEALRALSGYREDFPVVGHYIDDEDDDWILDGHAEWQYQYEKSQSLLKELHGSEVDDATFLLQLGSRIGLQEFKFASFDEDTFGASVGDEDDDFGDFQAAPSIPNLHIPKIFDPSDVEDIEEARKTIQSPPSMKEALESDDSQSLQNQNSQKVSLLENSDAPVDLNADDKTNESKGENSIVVKNEEPAGRRPTGVDLNPPTATVDEANLQNEEKMANTSFPCHNQGMPSNPQVISGCSDVDLPSLGEHTSCQEKCIENVCILMEGGTCALMPAESGSLKDRPTSDDSSAYIPHLPPQVLLLPPRHYDDAASLAPHNECSGDALSHSKMKVSPSSQPELTMKVDETCTPRPLIYNYVTPSKPEPKTPTTNNYSQKTKLPSSCNTHTSPSSLPRDSVRDEKKQEYDLDGASLTDGESDIEEESIITTGEDCSKGVPSVVQLFTEKHHTQRRPLIVPSTVRLMDTATSEAYPQTTLESSPFTPSPNHLFNQSLLHPLRLSMQLDRQSSIASHSTTSLGSPEGRFVRRASRMRKLFQNADNVDDQTSSDDESHSEAGSLGSLRSFFPDGNVWKAIQSTPSQEILDQTITDMLNGLEWEWVPYWKLDHLLQVDCDSSYVPLWLDQITQQLSTLDAMHQKISKRLHKLIQPHARELEDANRSALDLAKNLSLCQMYLERSQQSIRRAKYGSEVNESKHSFGSGVQGAQQLLRCWDTRESYGDFDETLNQVCKLYNMEKHILKRIEDYDIRLENSLEECKAIMTESEILHHGLAGTLTSRLDSLRELRERSRLIVSKTLSTRLHSWLEATTIRCCHSFMSGGFEAREYERLVRAIFLVELREKSPEEISESFCASIHTALLLEAQKSFGMALLNPTDSENEVSEYDKELLALSTKAYLDPSRMAIWTHNLVTIRFDFELSKNHLPAIYHKLCSLLTNVLLGHHCLLDWHRTNRTNEFPSSRQVMAAIFEALLDRRASIWNACVKVLEECLEEYLKFASKKKLFQATVKGEDIDSAWSSDLVGLEDVLGLTDQFLSLRNEFLDGVLEQVINDGSMLREHLFSILKKHLRSVHIEAMNTAGLMLYKETWSCFPLPDLEESREGIIKPIQKV